MRIFQSEQVMKLRNFLVFVGKTNGHRIRHISNNLDYHVWDTMLGHYQKYMYTPKPPNISWRLPCYRYGMICHRSSLIRHSSFRKRLRSCVAAAGGDFEHNIQFKYREGSWHSSLKRLHCWRKSRAKFDSILLNI